MAVKKEDIIRALQQIIHPGFGKDLMELGLIGDIVIEDKIIIIKTIPQKKDPFAKSVNKVIKNTISAIAEDSFEIQIEQMVEEKPLNIIAQSSLTKIKNIVAIASGKGGVGKSTIAVNLAVAMAKTGTKVGLLDADMFGPSIPKMFNVGSLRPVARMEDDKELIVPVEKYGVKLLSVGFFVDPENALVWRGPMATNALRQLIHQGEWGELDYLFFDLPPGTSDIHITLVQEVAVTGVIIVSTPQQVALADAIKGINMFRGEKINVPILGLIENMAWFTPDELPDKKYYIFGKEGCKVLADEMKVPLLGQIPIVENVTSDGDDGTPSALDSESYLGQYFAQLAKTVEEAVKERNKNTPSKKVVINK